MRLLGPTRARARSKIEVASLPNALIALDTMSPSSADSRSKLAHIGLNLPRVVPTVVSLHKEQFRP